MLGTLVIALMMLLLFVLSLVLIACVWALSTPARTERSRLFLQRRFFAYLNKRQSGPT